MYKEKMTALQSQVVELQKERDKVPGEARGWPGLGNGAQRGQEVPVRWSPAQEAPLPSGRGQELAGRLAQLALPSIAAGSIFGVSLLDPRGVSTPTSVIC